MKEIVERLQRLVEGISSAKRKYLDTGKISKDVFDKLVEIDPTSHKKYVDWLVRTYVKSGDKDLEHYKVVRDFDRLLNKGILPSDKRDINRYKTPEEIYDIVKRYEQTKTKGEIVRDIKRKDAEKVFENDKVIVVKPKSKEASCFYGKGTKWCTAASSSYNYFDNYYLDKMVNLYYVLVKGSNEKYAVAVHPDGKKEVFDAEDNSLPLSQAREIFAKFGLSL